MSGVPAFSDRRDSGWSPAARFALYYAPPRNSPWWDAGCAWLGRDPESGDEHTPPQPAGLERPLAALTREPRRYGWHGTLVAPFRLQDGVDAQALLGTVQRWAAARIGFEVDVEAAILGRFVALRPATDASAAALRELASDALRTLAPLRAAQTAAELERRLAAPLTARQRELLAEWGYPYVFDEFRFHMTLSDSLDDAHERALLVDAWSDRMQRSGPLPVNGVALFVEPEPGAPFVLWRRIGFGATNEPHA